MCVCVTWTYFPCITLPWSSPPTGNKPSEDWAHSDWLILLQFVWRRVGWVSRASGAPRWPNRSLSNPWPGKEPECQQRVRRFWLTNPTRSPRWSTADGRNRTQPLGWQSPRKQSSSQQCQQASGQGLSADPQSPKRTWRAGDSEGARHKSLLVQRERKPYLPAFVLVVVSLWCSFTKKKRKEWEGITYILIYLRINKIEKRKDR